MRGVRLLMRSGITAGYNARARRVAERPDSSAAGRSGRPDLVGSGWREAWRGARVVQHGAGDGAGAKGDAI
jgi:hypothetical protein